MSPSLRYSHIPADIRSISCSASRPLSIPARSNWLASSGFRDGRGGRAIKKMMPKATKVGADGEAVKKLESSAIPLLASLQGGVAERFRKYREASAYREAGVV